MCKRDSTWCTDAIAGQPKPLEEPAKETSRTFMFARHQRFESVKLEAERLVAEDVLLDLGVHILDDAWFIMGRPQPISVSAASHCAFSRFAEPSAAAPYDADDAVIALVRFANGATLSLTTTFAINASWHASDPFAERAYPQRYAPKYGGYCAYAIARDDLAPIDPNKWDTVEGSLYLNYSAKTQRD